MPSPDPEWTLGTIRTGSGGGGLSGTEGGRTHVKYVTEGVFFKNSACPRFVKEGYFFEPRYEVWGLKIPLRSMKYLWL